MKELIVLNGGGIDILYNIERVLKINPDVKMHSLSIWFGQDNTERCKKSVKNIEDYYNMTSDELVMPRDLTSPDPYNIGTRANTHQKVLFCTFASMVARQLNTPYIISGFDYINMNDQFEKKFVDIIKTSLVTNHIPIFVNPGRDITREKKHVYLEGHPLLSKTTSCKYKKPCGICFKCIARKNHNIELN